MKIVRPYARLINGAMNEGGAPGGPFQIADRDKILKHIEFSSRISHRSEDSVTEDSWKRIIQHVVMDHGDWSVVEHVSVSVDFLVDRGITHEIVRHRLFSYTQESTRFVNYDKEKDGKPVRPPSFIYPKPEVECEHCLGGCEVGYIMERIPGLWGHGNIGIAHQYNECKYDNAWLESIEKAEEQYKVLLNKKWRPQEARSVFPNALASRLIMTGNLRSWRHFFVMRTTQEAHPQMRQVTIPLLKEFQETFPLLYDDIQPNMKQSESMKSAR